jgi:hypothetical protein
VASSASSAGSTDDAGSSASVKLHCMLGVILSACLLTAFV